MGGRKRHKKRRDFLRSVSIEREVTSPPKRTPILEPNKPADIEPDCCATMNRDPPSGRMDGADNSGNVQCTTFRMSNYGKGLGDKIHQEDHNYKTVEDFVNTYVDDPSKRWPIKRVLVATNGIASVKAITSIRRMLMQVFGDDHIVKFTCLTTDHEIISNAEYLKLADFTVISPDGDNKNNYANVDEIVCHAVEQKVDAVWAGWGHASENPDLPRMLSERNIMFIGPPESAMFSLGDKIASTIIAQSVDIPTIEWSGRGVKLDMEAIQGTKITVCQDLFDRACVKDVCEGLLAMKTHQIGYPMMIKASEGGGGKGIRKCQNEDDFKENFVQVQAEVPGSPIFLMKCIEKARHIEVQLIADRYGRTIPIFTRDCSIQRRCQKIIEEAPASIAPKKVLRKMQEDAVRIAELVGYESAGTVEYLYLPSDETYYFLELNPRLQVEHPCTEMLANINIPAIQLQIAMGLPLHRIVDIRLFYGLDRYGTSDLPQDLVKTETDCHVIAARITSENPEDFFRPSIGKIHKLDFKSSSNTWGYFSVTSHGKVHEFADSQFGHLFARAGNRHDAISCLKGALKELEVRAEFGTQISYLVELLTEKDFVENNFNTQWLDQRIANKVMQKPPFPPHETIAISAAMIGYYRIITAFSNFKQALERGQILPTKDLTETFLFDLVKDLDIYKVTVTRTGPKTFRIYLNGAETQVEIMPCGDGPEHLVIHRKQTHTCRLEETADRFKVSIGSYHDVIFEKDNDPSVLKSPYTGKLISFKLRNGERVKVGDVYASVESMKMVFNVEVKKGEGRFEQVAKEGDLLYPGSVIGRITDQKDFDRFRPKPFTGVFSEWKIDSDNKSEINETKRYQEVYERCQNVLNGSIPPGLENNMSELIDDLFSYLESSTLPEKMRESDMTRLQKRIPVKYYQQLEKFSRVSSEGRYTNMRAVITAYLNSVPQSEYEKAVTVCHNLYKTCEKLDGGQFGLTTHVINELLTQYKKTESFFEGQSYDHAVAVLNEEYPTNKDTVVSVIYSHTQLKGKNCLMLALLKEVESRGMHLVTPLADNLREIGNMFHAEEVSEQCRNLLNLNSRVKYRKSVNKILWDSRGISPDQRDQCDVLSVQDCIGELGLILRRMVSNGVAPSDVPKSTSPWLHKALHEFFFDPEVADLAIRVQIFLHFADANVSSSVLPCGLTSYDFANRNNYASNADSSQHVSLIKLPDSGNDLSYSVTNTCLIDSLAEKYSKLCKANGKKSSLKVTFLVEDPHTANVTSVKSCAREALLEELPVNSDEEKQLVVEAENAAASARQAISARLSAVDVHVDVLICKKFRPMMQVDQIGSEKLELWRLPSNSSLVSDRLSNLHVFELDDETDKRFARLYAREIIEFPIRSESFGYSDKEDVSATLKAQLDAACGSMKVTMRRCKKNYVSNHVFLHISFPKLSENFTKNHEEELDSLFEDAIREQVELLHKHHITEIEVVMPKLEKYNGTSRLVNRRLKFLNETMVPPEFGIYDEFQTDIVPQKFSCQLYGKNLGMYPKIRKIEKKRANTRGIGTTYVYDFPTLFGRAVLERWSDLEDAGHSSEESLFDKQFNQLTEEQTRAFYNRDYRMFFDETELIVKNNELVKVTSKEEQRNRADNCNNETGCVAWELVLYPPEKPQGYSLVVIANDTTTQMGSFATPEDEVYYLASKYSRNKKIPRVNISCNTGARIGLAEELCKTFRVKFKNPENPDEGYDYLYVDGSEEENLKDQIVYDKMPNGLLKLKAVIGKLGEYIGVENLQGSGLIAGETSAAYDEVPTYCFVTGRSVGIGAYTARLAHRIVQVKASHLILTGAPALNTLLGKEVYTSNNQLGGTQIMYKNGVTHAVVENDYIGICKIVDYMSYLPNYSETFPYQQSFGIDSKKRPVSFHIEDGMLYDVRDLIDSKNDENVGICDTSSFDEIMNDWAKTIVAGRARIGGLPIGVVSSELKNVKSVTPADPACPNSQSVEVHQAGQVWYPDSAFKTAEVIGDFNREGLPLLFIASLRGFSGGQQDMFQMVLKFGAQIVDALRQYKQPVIIYIPCYGELRGGAWAVLDSKINPGFIQMVADKEARGGILEPPAIVGIKFREPRMLALQKRNDEIMKRLDGEFLDECKKNGDKSPEAARLRGLLAKRGEDLSKAYRNAAIGFADLHDRPERMKIKGAVQHVTALKDSRNLFIDIFTVESCKIRLLERYMKQASAEECSNRQDGYKWVEKSLNEFKSGFSALSPGEQLDVVQEFVESGLFSAQLTKVKAASVERELLSMSEEEMRDMKRMLEKYATQRKFSL